MMILTKSALIMMSCFILAMVSGIIILPILKKFKAEQRLSVYLQVSHKQKSNTPTMGGLIFIIPVIIIMVLMILLKKIEINYSLIIVMVTFISYFIIGFLDDYLIIKRNNNKGLSVKQKFLMQVFVSIIFFYLFMKAGNEPLLWIHTFNIKINIGFLYGFFILFVLLASSNAVNLTDGLDGLAAGLSFIALTTFGIITLYTTWLDGNVSLAIFLFILAGSVLGFLYYNSNPAKIFMGDTGSLALGAVLGATAIVTRHELLLALIGIVFVIETLTCVIQRIYYKFTRKRLFIMTPIHHAFEKKGWKEENIVRLFWIIGLIASMISLSFGVLL